MINCVVGKAFQSSNNQGKLRRWKLSVLTLTLFVKSTSFRLKKERKTEKKGFTKTWYKLLFICPVALHQNKENEVAVMFFPLDVSWKPSTLI